MALSYVIISCLSIFSLPVVYLRYPNEISIIKLINAHQKKLSVVLQTVYIHKNMKLDIRRTCLYNKIWEDWTGIIPQPYKDQLFCCFSSKPCLSNSAKGTQSAVAGLFCSIRR